MIIIFEKFSNWKRKRLVVTASVMIKMTELYHLWFKKYKAYFVLNKTTELSSPSLHYLHKHTRFLIGWIWERFEWIWCINWLHSTQNTHEKKETIQMGFLYSLTKMGDYYAQKKWGAAVNVISTLKKKELWSQGSYNNVMMIIVFLSSHMRTRKSQQLAPRLEKKNTQC